jgi:cytochrome b
VQVGLGLIAEDEDGIYFGPLAHLVSTDTSDTARDIHALNFDLILALIALHIGALLYYRFVRGKGLTLPMIIGRARVDAPVQPMQPAKWWVAALCLAVALGITRWVIAGAPPFGS